MISIVFSNMISLIWELVSLCQLGLGCNFELRSRAQIVTQRTQESIVKWFRPRKTNDQCFESASNLPLKSSLQHVPCIDFPTTSRLQNHKFINICFTIFVRAQILAIWAWSGHWYRVLLARSTETCQAVHKKARMPFQKTAKSLQMYEKNLKMYEKNMKKTSSDGGTHAKKKARKIIW